MPRWTAEVRRSSQVVRLKVQSILVCGRSRGKLSLGGCSTRCQCRRNALFAQPGTRIPNASSPLPSRHRSRLIAALLLNFRLVDPPGYRCRCLTTRCSLKNESVLESTSFPLGQRACETVLFSCLNTSCGNPLKYRKLNSNRKTSLKLVDAGSPCTKL